MESNHLNWSYFKQNRSYLMQNTFLIFRGPPSYKTFSDFSENMIVLATQLCLTLCHSMGCSWSGSSVHGIPRQEQWSGLSFPSPGDFTNPGIRPGSPPLQGDSLPSEPPHVVPLTFLYFFFKGFYGASKLAILVTLISRKGNPARICENDCFSYHVNTMSLEVLSSVLSLTSEYQ